MTLTLTGTREQIHAQLDALTRTHVVTHPVPLRLRRTGPRRYRTRIHAWTRTPLTQSAQDAFVRSP